MTERLRIVFVDDEPHILKGLQRSLSEYDDHYDFAFYASASAALEGLEQHPADVIVTDMRMPGMDGAQLLQEVRRRHPAIIRVILSGFAEAGSVLKTVAVAHVYLAKPCDTDALFGAITRPLVLRRQLANPALLAIIGEVSALPSLPALVLRIEEELCSPQASAASIAKLLAQDVAMTAEILKLTNSAFFGLGTRMTTALQAVRTLGTETIHSLVLGLGLFRQYRGDPTVTPLLAALNAHGITVGRLAEAMIQAAAGNEAAVRAGQCAGMLSSIGWLVLLDRFPQQCRAVLEGAKTQTPLSTIERTIFGATHNLVGAYLLGLWGFSDDIVEAVAFADEPSKALGRDNPVLAGVHVATVLGPRLPLPSGGSIPVAELDMAYLVEARQDGNFRRWQKLAENYPHGA